MSKRKEKKVPAKRNPIAPLLADPLFRPKSVPSKRKPVPEVDDYV